MVAICQSVLDEDGGRQQRELPRYLLNIGIFFGSNHNRYSTPLVYLPIWGWQLQAVAMPPESLKPQNPKGLEPRDNLAGIPWPSTYTRRKSANSRRSMIAADHRQSLCIYRALNLSNIVTKLGYVSTGSLIVSIIYQLNEMSFKIL